MRDLDWTCSLKQFNRANHGLDVSVRWLSSVGSTGVADKSGTHNPLEASRFGAGVGDAVMLAVQAQDEHGAAVHVAPGLIRLKLGSIVAFGGGIADAFPEAAAAE